MHISNLTFGYGSGTFNPQDKSTENRLYCKYNKANRSALSFREECVRVATLLGVQANGRRPTVLLSGGLDSEVVVKAFIESGVPFDVFTFEYDNGLNIHELKNAQRFCEQHKLKMNRYQINMPKFLRSAEAEELFMRSYAQHFAVLPHMKLMSYVNSIGGFPILGNGEVLLEQDQGAWKYLELEYDLAWYRHCINAKIPAACGFFQHTAEIQLSALQYHRLTDVVYGRNRLAKILKNTRQIKYKMYLDYWPDLIAREKFDGTELIRHLSIPRTQELCRLLPRSYSDRVLIPYEQMISDLTVQES